MTILKTILDETVGMFVDDGMLALLCVVLIAMVAAAVLMLGVPAAWGGIVLLAGCIAILAWSVLKATRH